LCLSTDQFFQETKGKVAVTLRGLNSVDLDKAFDAILADYQSQIISSPWDAPALRHWDRFFVS
jgi:hypothetical protein